MMKNNILEILAYLTPEELNKLIEEKGKIKNVNILEFFSEDENDNN